jgi:hypothetical protein
MFLPLHSSPFILLLQLSIGATTLVLASAPTVLDVFDGRRSPRSGRPRTHPATVDRSPPAPAIR